MLCPELSNFKSSSSSVKFKPKKALCNVEEVRCFLQEEPFITKLTFVFPEKLHCPSELRDTLLEDSQFYRAENLPLELLLSEEYYP